MKTKNALRSLNVILIMLSAGVMILPASGRSADYLGVKRCAICHKKAETGNQYGIWLESAHAKAFETLGTPEAKAVAAERGIADPQTSGACLKCHSTAYGFTEAPVTEKIKPEEGISCESCHGPGSEYAKKSVMEDREKALAAGLIIGDKDTCLQCHNAESPTYKPFNFEERWEHIKHPIPAE